MLDQYLQRLAGSTLPVPPALAIVAAALLLLAAQWAHARVQAVIRRQALLTRSEEPGDEDRDTRLELLRWLFAAALVGSSLALGPRPFAFFTGGYVVLCAYSLAGNLRSLRHFRDLAAPGAGAGTLQLAARTVQRARAHEAFGAGLFCLIVGLLLAQLALLGAALLMLATASGYARRARRMPRPGGESASA